MSVQQKIQRITDYFDTLGIGASSSVTIGGHSLDRDAAIAQLAEQSHEQHLPILLITKNGTGAISADLAATSGAAKIAAAALADKGGSVLVGGFHIETGHALDLLPPTQKNTPPPERSGPTR